jgi:hypothetical protein
MDEPRPAAKLRIPRSGADGKGARRGPRAESSHPARGGSGRGALAFLGLRRRARWLSTTNGKAGGQPMRPLSADGDKISM